MIVHYPNHVPAGRRSAQVFSPVDLMPTRVLHIGASLPTELIDGRDIWPILAGTPGATNPHR